MRTSLTICLSENFANVRPMLVCDSQVHIWAEQSSERPWAPGGPELHREMGHRREAIGFEELKDLMDEAGVDRVLICPPTWDLDRNDLGLAAAAKYPDRFGLMARVPLLDPETGKALLKSWQDLPGVKGVRLTFFRPAEATWLNDGTADWYWPIAEELNIPTMVHPGKFKQEIAEVAQKYPGLTLMLDHMGVPGGITDDAITPFVEETAALSQYPNLSVKVSGLPAKSSEPYPYTNLNGSVRTLVDAFGPRRCFWGTDLSRMLGFCGITYRQCVTHFTEHADCLSDYELEWIMGRALCEAVNWPAG